MVYNNKMNLEYVQFEITKEGLKAIYNDTDLNNNIKNVITNIDGGGLQAFKIKFNTIMIEVLLLIIILEK